MQQMGIFSQNKQWPSQKYFVYFKKGLCRFGEKGPLLFVKDFFVTAKNKSGCQAPAHSHSFPLRKVEY